MKAAEQAWRLTVTDSTKRKRTQPKRTPVHRTVKAYVNGSFIRSESGRTYRIAAASGPIDVVDSSRKDARDAIRFARAASERWAASSPYLRGQIMYRFAEMLENATHLSDLCSDLGLGAADNGEAADLLVHYAGYTDKLGQILGSANAVHGFSSSTEPIGLGVCAAYLPESASLLEMVEHSAAALASGNAIILSSSGPSGALACALAERAAVSDLPAGLWQVLPSSRSEVMKTLASSTDVRALDVLLHPDRSELEALASYSLTKIRHASPREDLSRSHRSLASIRWQIDYKTVLGPAGK